MATKTAMTYDVVSSRRQLTSSAAKTQMLYDDLRSYAHVAFWATVIGVAFLFTTSLAKFIWITAVQLGSK